ncbi:MAG: homoserine dehydrogenase [Candidatus Bipolaricaulota bacterium]|nr:homoserine dehydrogenase [Candidatus Bipolaricaulota bacterium]MDW8151472.1 homoserine dehydrogenase [Candidatus Bipolaricaulota bacterium]
MRLCLIGYGRVGYGFVRVLHRHGGWLAQRFGFAPRIVAVHDLRRGTVLAPAGLDLARLAAAWEENRDLGELGERGPGLDAFAVIRESEADVVVELTPTDLRTGEPAAGHIRFALASGKHVVTTNKGPVALFGKELLALAREHGVQFRFEGTVMAGTPLFSLVDFGLAAPIRRVRGILNGTTNFLLTAMEAGRTYAEALAEAQRRGYAEADPTADVEGHDALAKIVILANLVLEGDLRPSEVPCRGITGLDPAEVRRAPREGFRWKLVAEARRSADGVVAQVGPERLPLSDPLAQVGGALNALTLELDPLGAVTLVGPGAGPEVTGHAVLADLLAIHRGLR